MSAPVKMGSRLDWIKMTTDIYDKWQVIAMMRELKIRDQDKMVGLLFRFWRYCEMQSKDGKIYCPSAEHLDAVMNKPGLTAALITVGWLIDSETGFEVPKYSDHMGAAARKREANKQRMADQRAQEEEDFAQDDTDNAHTDTKSAQGDTSEHEKCTEGHEKDTKKEKEKENIKNTPLPPKGGKDFDPKKISFPQELDKSEFHEAWFAWCDHREEIRKKLTEQSVKLQLGELVKRGLPGAIEVIQYSIRQGWTGLHPPNASKDRVPAQTSDVDYFEQQRQERLKLQEVQT